MNQSPITDPLDGAVPTWRTQVEESPIYASVIADLGSPFGDVGPGPIVAGGRDHG